MRINIAVVITARHAALELRLLGMPVRPIDAAFGDSTDGAVRQAARGIGSADLNNAADPASTMRAKSMPATCVAVDPIDHDSQALAQIVGQIFVDNAVDDRTSGGRTCRERIKSMLDRRVFTTWTTLHKTM